MKAKRRRMWIAIVLLIVGLVGLVALGLKRMMDRPMFEPGTVTKRVAASGGSLEPLATDPTPDVWAVAPGITLRHDSFGEGSEEVVFVHGGPGFPVRGRPRGLEALSKTARVHVFDQRGCGGSTRPFARAPEGAFYTQLTAVEDRLGLAAQIADLERIRRRLGRDRIVLVGHSFGGLVAVLYAAEFPKHVRALVLASPAPLLVMPKDGDLFELVRRRLPRDLVPEYDDYMRGYFDFTAHMKQDEATLSKHFGAFRHFYAASVGQADDRNEGDAGGFMTLATFASLGRRHDWRPAMMRVEAKTVVLHGAADLVPAAETRAFAEAIPHAELEVVPDAGHFVIDDAPDALVRAVQRALGVSGETPSTRAGVTPKL